MFLSFHIKDDRRVSGHQPVMMNLFHPTLRILDKGITYFYFLLLLALNCAKFPRFVGVLTGNCPLNTHQHTGNYRQPTMQSILSEQGKAIT